MVHKTSPEEKHKTGRAPQTSDFVKHECAAAVTEVWKAGKKAEERIVQKAEFARIPGNEKMIAVNSRASDECPFCHLDIEDAAFIPCTDQDVEMLSK